MTRKFVVSHLDQQLGPYTEQEIKMKWAAGEILPIDYVFDDQKQDWVLLADNFEWAAKPVTDDGAAPPPIREANILKRSPPPKGAVKVIETPAPVVATPVVAAKPAPAITAAAAPVVTSAPSPVASTPIAASTVSLEPAPIRVTVEAKPASAPVTPVQPVAGQTQVHLVNGEGEVDFTPIKPGAVELAALDVTGSNIKSTESLKIHVKAPEPVAVTWEYPNHQVVGQDLEVKVFARDERGLVCEHYNDQYLLQIRGPVAHDVNVPLVGGKAIVTLSHVRAEKWDLSLQYSGAKHVRLPDPSEIEWRPGPAVRLVLDGPHEYLAGDSMKVRVKAVDVYGNTANTFQGAVALEIKTG